MKTVTPGHAARWSNWHTNGAGEWRESIRSPSPLYLIDRRRRCRRLINNWPPFYKTGPGIVREWSQELGIVSRFNPESEVLDWFLAKTSPPPLLLKPKRNAPPLAVLQRLIPNYNERGDLAMGLPLRKRVSLAPRRLPKHALHMPRNS